MADNYIERQYEKYEARKAAWEKARKMGKKKTVKHAATAKAVRPAQEGTTETTDDTTLR